MKDREKPLVLYLLLVFVGRKRGSMFTLFLMDPLLGLCQLCQLVQTTHEKWKKCKELLNKLAAQAIQSLAKQSSDAGELLYLFFVYAK